MGRSSPAGRTPRLGELLLDLLVPQECAGCGRPGSAWCQSCAAAVRRTPVRLARAEPAAAAGEHAGPLGPAVVAFKDRGQRRLAAPLASALAEATRFALGVELAGHPVGTQPVETQRVGTQPVGTQPVGTQPVETQPVWLIPVPVRREARRRRGMDHTAVLAAHAARELRRTGWNAHRCRVLAHAAQSQDQVGLSGAQRRANLVGTLSAVAKPPPGILVVVDDVTTTGSTLDEAVRALRAEVERAAEPGVVPVGPPILVATITVSTLVRGSASGDPGH